jgi:hypothetical protein
VIVLVVAALVLAVFDVVRGGGDLLLATAVYLAAAALSWYVPPIKIASDDPSKSTIQRIREKRRESS